MAYPADEYKRDPVTQKALALLSEQMLVVKNYRPIRKPACPVDQPTTRLAYQEHGPRQRHPATPDLTTVQARAQPPASLANPARKGAVPGALPLAHPDPPPAIHPHARKFQQAFHP